MSGCVALLRGVNVGGRNTIPMAELRSVCRDLGWANVQTYIQSGNVIFQARAAAPELEGQLERGLERTFGLSIPALVRTAAEWTDHVRENPFPEACEVEPNRVMLALSKHPPRNTAVDELARRAEDGESVARVGDALWLHYPGGAGRSKLSATLLDRLVGSPVTVRNWRTVLRIEELLGRIEAAT